MRLVPGVGRRHLASAARVALVATLMIVVVYLTVVAILDLVVAHRLVSQVDTQLASRLASARQGGALAPADPDEVPSHVRGGKPTPGSSGLGIYGAPIFVWEIGTGGSARGSTPGAPELAPSDWSRGGSPTTAELAGTEYRLSSIRQGSGWLVAGESLAELSHVEGVLLTAEAVGFPALCIAVFLVALAIGIRAVSPVERSHKRQLEFTADASHELRTPLSVIDAEVSLARRMPRDASHYEDTLDRVREETARLGRIVEDLLWLARSDAEPPPPRDTPVDLTTIAEGCVDRFGAVARQRSIDLELAKLGDRPAFVDAPPDWVDRLAGVLLDNACRYAGEGGSVRVVVGRAGNRAVLAVEDSGPGIAPEDRDRIFDRFRRGTDEPGGHGLGLAIADSVVRSTGGRWRITESPAGGARMEVSWPATSSRRFEPAP